MDSARNGDRGFWGSVFFLERTNGEDVTVVREQFNLWCSYVMGGK